MWVQNIVLDGEGEDEGILKQMYDWDREDEEAATSSTIKKKRKQIDRGRIAGDIQLWNDYFAPTPVYDESFFRRRFRMSSRLFNRVLESLMDPSKCELYKYFTQRYDALGRKCLSPRQKCTSAIRQLAYGTSTDQVDEYIRIGESTALECLYKFCRSVVQSFREEYLRTPNQDDVDRLVAMHLEGHGFNGMLGSIDCMHWGWKNCPTAWKGHYTRGDHGHPTIMLEAVASKDLWIWHAFFGVAGSNNDINVLNQSPVFNQVLEGNAPDCEFEVNGNVYTKGYYLADGIYPEWSTLVKSFAYPPKNNLKMKYFKKRQESARKDVERAFGVLQARWAIIREDEWENVTNWAREEHEPDPEGYVSGATAGFQARMEGFRSLRSKDTHQALRNDLIEFLWENKLYREEIPE